LEWPNNSSVRYEAARSRSGTDWRVKACDPVDRDRPADLLGASIASNGRMSLMSTRPPTRLPESASAARADVPKLAITAAVRTVAKATESTIEEECRMGTPFEEEKTGLFGFRTDEGQK